MTSDARVLESPEALGEARTVYQALVATAADDPAREYMCERAGRVTFGELLAEADADAGRLSTLGIGAGDHVVLWLPNGRRWASLFFACGRLGAVVVTAGTRLRTIDLRHVLADSRARALVYVPRAFGVDFERMVATLVAERERGGLPDLAHTVSVGGGRPVGGIVLDDVEPAADLPPFDDPDAPTVVCYTSGTTGRPKGCVHAHRALVRNGTVAAGLTGLGPGDRILCPVPFAHVFGFHMGVLQAALSGATIVNAEPYRAERVLDQAEQEAATVLYAVPAMAREMLAAQECRPRDLSALRLVVVAGAPVSAEMRRRVADPRRGFGSGLSVVYGCTEAPTLTQLLPEDPPAKAADSIGRPTPGVEVRVCRPGTGDAAGTGVVGEILARGYNTMLRYLHDPHGTAEKHRGGWLMTGDMGWMDAEGFLYFVGRSSEMFLVGGFNAYPREIEVQLEQLEDVVEAAVVGVPDERLGCVPMAWLTASSPALSEQDVLEWTRHHLASYKRPRYVRVVESLPRTANGKLSRVKLERLSRRALPHLNWETCEV